MRFNLGGCGKQNASSTVSEKSSVETRFYVSLPFRNVDTHQAGSPLRHYWTLCFCHQLGRGLIWPKSTFAQRSSPHTHASCCISILLCSRNRYRAPSGCGEPWHFRRAAPFTLSLPKPSNFECIVPLFEKRPRSINQLCKSKRRIFGHLKLII